MKRKYIFVLALLITNTIIAQVSSVTRNKESYTQDVFPYNGVRIIQVDEVHHLENEENVFIFSKIAKNSNPDEMYFQRFTKKDGKWVLLSSFTINHNGIISAWGSRKGFADYNKDKSVDAFFIYGLYDSDFKQQAVHLLYSEKDQIYTIGATISDGFVTNSFSDNFKSLNSDTKKQILDYWEKLDKKDN